MYIHVPTKCMPCRPESRLLRVLHLIHFPSPGTNVDAIVIIIIITITHLLFY